jgi:hypothetical protein
MSTSSEPQAEWLGSVFWERLDLLEQRHQRLQTQHEGARRGLEKLASGESHDLLLAWERYCAVIAELDQTAMEFEELRTRAT